MNNELPNWKFIEVFIGFVSCDKQDAARQQLVTRGFSFALDALKGAPLTGMAAPIIANRSTFPNPYH